MSKLRSNISKPIVANKQQKINKNVQKNNNQPQSKNFNNYGPVNNFCNFNGEGGCCDNRPIYLNDGYQPSCTQALFNSYYGYVMNSTSTTVPFTLTLVNSPSSYCNNSNFVVQMTLDTGYELQYVNPINPSVTCDTIGRPGQLFVLANLGSAVLPPGATTASDYTSFNSLYYILSTPTASDPSYYLVGFNLAYFETGDAILIHGNIIDSTGVVSGTGNGIYIIATINYQLCTFTLTPTGLESYNRYQPVHISQNYDC